MDQNTSTTGKRVITAIIIILVAIGAGYFLFKISPQQSPASAYNASLDSSNVKTISSPLPFDEKTDHFQGNPKAKNVFLEYGDVQCPACAAYNPILKQVTSQFPDTVFVFRYFPLIQVHQNAVEGALANEAAGAQGKYWEMHDILFEKQSEWENLSDPLDKFVSYAQQVGVSNLDQFKSDITSKKYLPTIQKNFSESLGLNLPGTPTLYFNGHVLQNQDLAGLLKQSQQYVNK